MSSTPETDLPNNSAQPTKRLDLSQHEQDDTPGPSLADFCWDAEPIDGGLLLRRNKHSHRTQTGCTFALLLPMYSLLAISVWLLSRFLRFAPPEKVAWRILWLMVPLTMVGSLGLFAAIRLVQALRFALVQDEWEARPNWLLIRRRVLWFFRCHEFRNAEFVLEPKYLPDGAVPLWGLAVCAAGEKHFLLGESSRSIWKANSEGLRLEAAFVAETLAAHTGWKVTTSDIAIDGQTKPLADDRDEVLLAVLRTRRFAARVDERRRLVIRPPKVAQLIGGLVLCAIGGIWLWGLCDEVWKFVEDAQARQEPLMQGSFWLVMTPILTVVIGLCALGVAACCAHERWIVDGNRLLIRSQWLGWRSEHEYVQARWRLTHVCRSDKDGNNSLLWELQLENQSGQTLKTLCQERDDDVPRLLGTVLSQRTGWPLHQDKVHP